MMKDSQVYSSEYIKNHYAMDQEIEIKINLTSEQFLISETFCCVHTSDQKETTIKLKMLEARTQLEDVRYSNVPSEASISRTRFF
jgi:hypothetical protein